VGGPGRRLAAAVVPGHGDAGRGDGAMGTFVGTVSGRTATFTLTQTTPGCSGTFSGHAVVMPSPELLVYYYSGTDCLGTHTNGNGSATR